MARFGSAYFGSARFGVEEISEAQLSLLDTLKKSFVRSLADSITLSEALQKAIALALSESMIVREEQNLTLHIGPWSESFEECTPGRYTSSTSIGANWTASPGSGGVCEILTDGGKFGSNYARITDDPTHSWKAFVGSGKAFTLEKGKWYRASVYARSSAVRGSYAYLFYAYGESRLYKAVSWGLTELGPDKGWVRKEIRFQVPADATVTAGYPYLYGHINHNNTVSEVDYDGYRIEGPFDSDPGPITDSPVLAVGMQKGEAISLADTAWQGFSASLTDALTLSESIARLVAAVRGDSATLSDLLTASALKTLSDALSLADAYAAGATLGPSDVLTLVEGFSVAVGKALADTLSLADAIALAVGASRSDALALAEALAVAAAIGLGDDSLALTDAWLKTVTLNINDYAGSVNRCPPFSEWTLSGGAYVDNDGILHLPNYGAKAVSPYIILGRAKNWWFSADYYSDLPSPYADFQPDSGSLQGSAYFNISMQAAKNDGGWTGNGNAQKFPIGVWTRKYWSYLGGDNVAFIQINISTSTTWTPEHYDVRNPMLTVDGTWETFLEYGIRESVTNQVGVSAADLLTLTEGLVKATSTSLAEALTLAEALQRAVEACMPADSASASDTLRSAITKVLSDVASLADAIRSAIDVYPGRSSLFGLARFGHESFGNQQPGEAVSLRDAIASAIGFGVLAEDMGVLADTIRCAIERLAAENPALLDTIASGLVAQRPDETALASDALALEVARAVESLLTVSDALMSIAAEKGIGDTVSPLVDTLTRAAAKVVGLAFALGDQATAAIAKALGNEVIALADSIAQSAGMELGDIAVELGSVLESADVSATIGGARFGRSTFGAVSFGDAGTRAMTADDLAKAISTVLSEAISHVDALALQAIKTAASSMTLSEAVSLAAQKVVGDSASIVDLNTFALTKSLGLSVAVADELAKAVAVALQGLSVATADQVQAALAMLRQAQDEMAIVDGVARAINLLRDELVALADEARKDIDAKQGETLAIASALGKDVAAFPPGDVTGLLDEAQLLGALLAGDLMAPLIDAVTGEVYEVISQVFINGISVVTVGLSIKESTASRVGECSFTIPDPSARVLALCQQGADVHVMINDSAENIIWGGRIVWASVVSVSALVREVRIVAQDYATRAQSILASGAWINTEYTDVVKALWQQYAPEDNLVLDVADHDKVAEKWVVKWESLAEATDKIAQILGWTWRVDWDGGQKIFQFFDPGAEVHPRALSVANLNIESGTAEFGQDEEIVNSVYVLGGQALYQPDPYREVADGQKTYFILPARPFEPIVVKVNGVEKVWTYETPYWPEGKDCLINPEGRYVRFQTAPASGAVIEVTYQTTRPVRAHLTEPGSIALYGVHNEVVNDSKIADPLQARETARKILREKAWPKQHGRMEVYEPGLRAGKIVHVYLPDRGIDGLYQVSEMSWAVDRAVIRRSISLNRVADAGASIAQVIKNLAQRVAALEAEKDTENPVIDRFIDQSQRLRIAAGAEWLGDVRPPVLQTTEGLADGHVRAHQSGTAIYAWADGVTTIVIPDSGTFSVSALCADVPMGLSYHAKISTSQFGFSRFGEARAGAEVRG